MQGVLPCSPGTVNAGAHNTIDASEACGGSLTVFVWYGSRWRPQHCRGKMLAPTTLLWFCHAKEVAGYYPTGVQGTVLSIAVDLSAPHYFLCLFPGSYRAGVPGRSV